MDEEEGQREGEEGVDREGVSTTQYQDQWKKCLDVVGED